MGLPGLHDLRTFAGIAADRAQKIGLVRQRDLVPGSPGRRRLPLPSQRQPDEFDCRIVGIGVLLEPEGSADGQHGAVLAQDVAEDLADAAFARIVDQTAHQQRPEPLAGDVIAYCERELRLLLVGVGC